MKIRTRHAASAVVAGLIVAAGVATPLVVSGPASAAVTGSTGSGDVVLYPTCQQHVVSYSIDVSGSSFWNLEIQSESPDDIQSGGTVLSSTKDSPTTGTVSTTFCGSEEPGTWKVHGSGIYQSGGDLLGLPVGTAGVNQNYTLPDSTFHVRRAMTKTSLTSKKLHTKKSRHQGNRVKLIVGVLDERVDGYGRTDGAPIELQKLVDGSWVKVKNSSQRTFHGRADKVLRVTSGAAYRAVTYGRGNYDGSTSAPLRVR